MEKKVLNEMFENLLHIGNKANYWNPKVREYIYASANGIHVINLVKTLEKLEKVKKDLEEATKAGKKVLIVATKLQVKDAFVKLAIDTGSSYVSEKWVPGLLTNFKTIRRRISTYMKLLEDANSGALDVLTKKEKAVKLLELEKLDKSYKWLKDLKGLPDIVFVVDGIFETQALKEAKRLGITSYEIINTNGDIDMADDFIVANTNSTKAMDYLAAQFTSSIVKWVKRENVSVVKKVEERKISWDKKFKAPAKTEKKVETQEEAPAKKAPAKKTTKKEA